MRNWLALLLVCTLLLAFTACGKEPDTSSSVAGTTTSTAPQADTTTASVTTTTSRTQSQETTKPKEFTPITSVQDYFETISFYDSASRGTVRYMLHEPRRYSEEPAPLIIFLHGLGEAVTEANPGLSMALVSQLINLENTSAEYRAYTLVPVTPTATEGWWTYQQRTAFKKLFYELLDTHNIDPKRVYIMGISMGGFLTCQLVNEMPPDTFAAAVPFSGANNMSNPRSLHNTAFRIYHAKDDAVVQVACSRALYQQLTIMEHPNVEYTEFEFGDHISPLYDVLSAQRDTFFPWLFSQRLP